jgi:hypothetical protein
LDLVHTEEFILEPTGKLVVLKLLCLFLDFLLQWSVNWLLLFDRVTGASCAMKEVNIIPDDPKSAECIKQLEQVIFVFLIGILTISIHHIHPYNCKY